MTKNIIMLALACSAHINSMQEFMIPEDRTKIEHFKKLSNNNKARWLNKNKKLAEKHHEHLLNWLDREIDQYHSENKALMRQKNYFESKFIIFTGLTIAYESTAIIAYLTARYYYNHEDLEAFKQFKESFVKPLLSLNVLPVYFGIQTLWSTQQKNVFNNKHGIDLYRTITPLVRAKTTINTIMESFH